MTRGDRIVCGTVMNPKYGDVEKAVISAVQSHSPDSVDFTTIEADLEGRYDPGHIRQVAWAAATRYPDQTLEIVDFKFKVPSELGPEELKRRMRRRPRASRRLSPISPSYANAIYR